MGQKVATLVNDIQTQGSYFVEWNAKDQATGMYFMKLTFGNDSKIQKLMLVK